MTDNIVDITERLKDKDLGFKYYKPLGSKEIGLEALCGDVYLEGVSDSEICIGVGGEGAHAIIGRKELAQFLHAAVVFLDSEGRYGIEQGLTVPALSYSDAENEKLKRFMGQFEFVWETLKTTDLKVREGMKEALRSGLVQPAKCGDGYIDLTTSGRVYFNENFGGDL